MAGSDKTRRSGASSWWKKNAERKEQQRLKRKVTEEWATCNLIRCVQQRGRPVQFIMFHISARARPFKIDVRCHAGLLTDTDWISGLGCNTIKQALRCQSKMAYNKITHWKYAMTTGTIIVVVYALK